MRYTPLLLLVTLATLLLVSAAQAVQARPNYIVIFIDDLGWGDFGCFGNQDAQTPHIDRLAAEGLRFSQFYVNSPICSPSRVALTTGRYPQTFGIGSYLDNRQTNKRRGIADWLTPEAATLARMLQSAGYATGHFGKWHMGGQRDIGEAPLITEYGFDQSLTNMEGLGDRVLPLLITPDQSEPRKYPLGSDKLGRGNITWCDRSEVTAAFIDAAIDFIDRAVATEQPFYVNVWPDDVHSPFAPPLEKWGDGEKRTLYLAVLETMDEQLGKLLEHVRNSPRLRENTIILVCSDNGPEPGAGSAGEFRGGKACLYEGGIRSPLIVWAPKLMDSNARGQWNRESFLAAIDLVPSLLELAQVEAPPEGDLDGEALADVLLGESTASRSKPLFFRRPPDRGRGHGERNLPDLAVRAGSWKLLCEYDGSKPQLYDLDQDPRESHNIAADHPQVVADLTRQLLAWHGALPADRGPSLSPSGRTDQQ